MNATASPRDIAPLTAVPDDAPPRRGIGLAVVIAVHLLVGYALASGLAGKAIEVIKKPLQATIVEQVKVPEPPPPPPPPKPIKAAEPPPRSAPPPPPYVPPVEVAQPNVPPVISSVSEAPPKEVVPIAPPAPPAPVVQAAPPAPPAPRQLDIGVACPSQVAPQMPARAVNEGISGLVRAQVRIHDGRVQEVTILSGPKVFHEAVRAAMLQYQCDTGSAGDVLAVQEIKFQVE